MSAPSPGPARVTSADGLGRAERGRDLLLGWAALVPPPLLAVACWLAPAGPARDLAVTTALAWSGALLAFLSGVRRGLSFSEAKGARLDEVAGFLALFAVAFAGILLSQPLVLAAGFVMAGVLDARAARRGEAPGYFRRLRPAQAALGALSLAAVAARLLTR